MKSQGCEVHGQKFRGCRVGEVSSSGGHVVHVEVFVFGELPLEPTPGACP